MSTTKHKQEQKKKELDQRKQAQTHTPTSDNQSREEYVDAVLSQVPAILTCLNRNPLSESHGSFDREYWHYGQRDFSCCRMQEAALTLALLYHLDHSKNKYHQSQALLDGINAALAFWCTLVHDDGSLSEWYPNEHSFVGSAFSLYAMSETLLVMSDEREKLSSYKPAMAALDKVAGFLLSKRELRVQNQATGAIAGFANLHELTSDHRYKEKAESLLQELAEAQHTEGWFEEYGGADIGYLSLAIDYLAKYHRRTESKEAMQMMEKAVEFLSYFVHADSTAGGEYGSRNTEYLIPFGIEYLATKGNKNAAVIARKLRTGLQQRTIIGPWSWDTRYLLYVGYTYLQAYQAAANKLPTVAEERKARYFSGAGLAVHQQKVYTLITSLKKGGSWRLVSNDGHRDVADAGVSVRTGKGGFTSAAISQFSSSIVLNKSVRVEGKLVRVKSSPVGPFSFVGLRLYGATLGRFSTADKKVKEKLRDLLITPGKQSSITAVREIILHEDHIEVVDTVTSPDTILQCCVGKHSFAFVPSSRLFQEYEKDTPVYFFKPNSTSVEIRRTVYADGKKDAVEMKAC